jgi:hypothetical protein
MAQGRSNKAEIAGYDVKPLEALYSIVVCAGGSCDVAGRARREAALRSREMLPRRQNAWESTNCEPSCRRRPTQPHRHCIPSFDVIKELIYNPETISKYLCSLISKWIRKQQQQSDGAGGDCEDTSRTIVIRYFLIQEALNHIYTDIRDYEFL